MNPSQPEPAEKLEHEIEAVRDNIGDLVTELDHRRHDAFDVGLQMRRHGFSLALAALALAGLSAGGILLARRRARVRQRLPARARGIGQALARIMEHPEREVQPPPSIGLKILAAAGVAAASMLTKRLLQGVPVSSTRSAPR